MKSVISLFGWMVVLALGFLVFVYFFQKQQNEHQERMVSNTANLVQIKHNTEVQLVHLGEQRTIAQKVSDIFRSIIGLAIKMLS